MVCSSFRSIRAGKGKVFYFLAKGGLLRIDASENTLSYRGGFHPTAPDLDQAPGGLIWARSGYFSVSILDPDTKTTVDRIHLPFRPYQQIILPEGKAYITHNNLTPEGFLISVVDVQRRQYLKTFGRISGLTTGLAQSGSYVYLAALGVRNPGRLYLYEIDSQKDSLKLIYSAPKNGYRWDVAVKEERLYVCYLADGMAGLEPRIDIFDLHTEKRVQTILGEQLPGIRRLTSGITFAGGRAFVSCDFNGPKMRGPRAGGSGTGLAELSADTLELVRLLPVRQRVHRIVGIDDPILYFVDYSQSTGEETMNLYVYDLEEMEIIQEIELIDFGKTARVYHKQHEHRDPQIIHQEVSGMVFD